MSPEVCTFLEITPRYERLRLIGSGSMGTVFEAHDSVLGRRVAVKALARELSAQEADFFKREFQTVSSLDHPNLLKVYDFGQTASGQLFYSMELLPHGTLASLSPPLDTDSLLSAIVQLCRALQYIHTRGIVHLDLKPANVLLAAPAADGSLRLKLADFGLASLHRDSATPRGGTPAYAAPELLEGRGVDPRADLFSLGVIAYELATSSLPYDWHGAAPGRVEPPSSLNSSLPEELDSLLLKLLELEPSNRYRDANSVIEAINRLFATRFSLETERTQASYVLSPALIGRDRELETIEAELRSLIAREPVPAAGLILITGPTGMGKSRLLAQAKRFCQLNGIAFCAGGSSEHPTIPAEAIVQAVRTLVHSLPRQPKLPAALAPLLGSRSRAAEPTDPSAVAEATYQLFAQGAKHRPLALCIEDLHWADPLTLTVLGHLARGFLLTPLGDFNKHSPVRILLTADLSHQMSKQHRALLKELTEAPYTAHLPLEPLSSQQVAELISSMFGAELLSPEAAEKLRAVTSGLPLFLQQLIRQLLDQGAIHYSLGQWKLDPSAVEKLPLPRGALQMADAALSALSSEQRSILQALSVLTVPVPPETAAALAQLHYAETKNTLRGLADRGLLTVAHGRYSLPPGPLRARLLARLHWTRKRKLHLAAAHALRSLPLDRRTKTHALAHHYIAARHSDGALEWGLTAARESYRAQANAQAASYYQGLLRLQLPPNLHRDLLTEYGQTLARMARYREAVDTLKRALAIMPTTTGPETARLLRLIADAHEGTGDFAAARRCLRRALKIPNAGPEELALAHARLASRLHDAGKAADANRHISHALTLAARPRVQRAAGAYVQRIAGNILTERGETRNGLAHFHRSLRLATSARDLDERTSTYTNLVAVCIRLGEYSRAIRTASTALRLSSHLADPESQALQLLNLGGAYFSLGNYKKVISCLLEALPLFRRMGKPRAYGQCLHNVGLVQMHCGQYESALEYLGRAISIHKRQGVTVLLLNAQGVMASLVTRTGQLGYADALLRRSAKLSRAAGIPRELAFVHKNTAEIARLKGDLSQARQRLAAALAIFEKVGETDEICECLCLLALLETDAGNHARARKHSRKALELARSLKSKPLELAAAASAVPGSYKEARKLLALSRQVEDPELRWRAHARCAEYYAARGELRSALDHYAKCVAIFRSVVADMKNDDLKNSYLNHPDRVRILEEIQRLRRRVARQQQCL